MAFRPSYGVSYPHYSQQQIMFGQMRMPSQNAPASKPAPETPVFIGNITENCSDEFMQKILAECGKVSSWKRISGTNGKLQAFGFCNFAEPDGTLRVMRILNDFQLGDKRLTVKADDKVKMELRKAAIEMRRKKGKKDLPLKPDELPADEDDLRADEEIRLKILNWIEVDHPELVTAAEDGELSEKDGKKDEKKDRNKKDRRRRSRSVERGRRSRSRESPKRKRSRRSRSSSSSSSDSGTTSESSGSSSGSSRSRRSRPKSSNRRRKERSASRSSEDSEDAREKRYIRQLVKEKEQAYLARLKRWESREKQRAKIYERDERKEKDRKKELHKEAKKLKAFLEDYDDENDDPKYYKSSMLFQRKRDFEKEKEMDQKDRLREQVEIEELKKQIMAENNNGVDVDEEAKKRHELQEAEALRKLRADSGSPNPHQPLGHSVTGTGAESSSSEGSGDDDDEGEENGTEKSLKSSALGLQSNTQTNTSTPSQEEVPKPNNNSWKAIGSNNESNVIARPTNVKKTDSVSSPAPGSSSVQPIAQRLSGVFGTDDDDEDELHKKKKLKPFEITREERMQVMSADEKRELTRGIIKKIPTTKEDLFATPIEWDYIDEQVMQSRIKPWVSKKVKEFIGDEETTLVDFIMEKLEAKTTPDQITIDIRMIIDDDADMFVVKMWRLLVYEGQARKLGVN